MLWKVLRNKYYHMLLPGRRNNNVIG